MNHAIPFNRPPYTGNEDQYVLAAMRSERMSGDGEYGQRCQRWLTDTLGCTAALLTPSCTQALEMAALLVGIQPGDEVVMPSYTFVSTANAFVLRGATIVFVDIRPDTMNIDEQLIESAITEKTKAIVPVHYAGVGCDMETIMSIAGRYGVCVIEDAAQGFMASYKGSPLGTIGHMGAYSFHETKNVTSGGEGGLLIVNDDRFVSRAEVIREKGTNRSQFFQGMVDKYSWVDVGSNYLLSEIQAAYLWGQIECADAITNERMESWCEYFSTLDSLAKLGVLGLPIVPPECTRNGHMFYLKTRSLAERTALLAHLRAEGIYAVFHYVPLHSASAGIKYARFNGEDRYTTKMSERVIRLPLFFGMEKGTCAYISESIFKFYASYAN